MPLVGFMSRADPGRISTITSLPGDMDRRKRLLPIPTQMPILHDDNKELQLRTYVRDCLSHDPMGAVVPVVLKRHDGPNGWEELGVSRCCPLCWLILLPPDGIDLPIPMPQPLGGGKHKKRKTANRTRRTGIKPVVAKPIHPVRAQIEAYALVNDRFTLPDLRELTGLSRIGVRKWVFKLINEGLLELYSEGGGGRGNTSVYRKKKAP